MAGSYPLHRVVRVVAAPTSVERSMPFSRTICPTLCGRETVWDTVMSFANDGTNGSRTGAKRTPTLALGTMKRNQPKGVI